VVSLGHGKACRLPWSGDVLGIGAGGRSRIRQPLCAARRGAPRPAGRATAALRRRAARHLPPLRPPVDPDRPAPALGPYPADKHPLALPHDLGSSATSGSPSPTPTPGTPAAPATPAAPPQRPSALTEVATALAALTGEPHPLTEPEEGRHGSASHGNASMSLPVSWPGPANGGARSHRHAHCRQRREGPAGFSRT